MEENRVNIKLEDFIEMRDKLKELEYLNNWLYIVKSRIGRWENADRI